MVRPACSSLLAVLLFGACSTGNETPPRRDWRPRLDVGTSSDDRQLDQQLDPDRPPRVDTARKPDLPRADKPPKVEPNPCGNKVLDPGEECDKAIVAGQLGACPQSLADCDDKNKCTTDGFTGVVSTCTAACSHQAITNCCGNGTVDAGEGCDDGNVVESDGCSNTCKLPGGHLLITELATSPSEAEFIELHNPTTQPVPLEKVYLADRVDYYQLPKGGMTGAAADFIARFPAGATLAPGAYLTIALQGSLDFKTAFGKAPDYELVNSEAGVPDLVPAFAGSISSTAGLTDTGEVLTLFTWDGASDLIQDIDYVRWQATSSLAVWKTTTHCIDGPDTDTTPTCFKADTDLTLQSFLKPPQPGGSLHRCNYLEGAEVKTGGNGATSHNETSEPFDGTGATWKGNPATVSLRTPGKTAPLGFCPQL